MSSQKFQARVKSLRSLSTKLLSCETLLVNKSAAVEHVDGNASKTQLAVLLQRLSDESRALCHSELLAEDWYHLTKARGLQGLLATCCGRV